MKKYKIKRLADYDQETDKFAKRKVEKNMDEEIVDICHKIRKYANKIEEAISDRREKNEKRV